MSETAARRNLYALLVGIDRYESIRGLQGCVQDVRSMQSYLGKLTEFTPQIKVLTSPGEELPTKENLISGFRDHLSQAQKGDVVLFYFAGHGVREKTHIPAFQRVEPDNCLETLVCYDSKVQSGPGMTGTMLADKEIRYLMNTYLNHEDTHVLVITDCCHSGGNTRSLVSEIDEEEGLSSRMARPRPIPARRYDGFLFHEEIPLEKLEPADVLMEELLPQARHIQMAACRAVEEAWEARRPNGSVGGFFTITLLEILQQASAGISYYELKERATTLMKNMKKRPQTPQVYASGPDPNDLYQSFLSGSTSPKPTFCAVSYNMAEGWNINLGAIHGVPANADKNPVDIQVTDGAGNTFEAKTLEVFPGSSTIKFMGKAPEKSAANLRGEIEGIGIHPLNIFIEGDQSGMESFLRIFQEHSQDGQNIALELVQKEGDAQYVVRPREGRFYLTHPFDDKPLIEPAWGQEPDWAQVMYDYLIHISQWTFFNKLHHADTHLHKNAPPSYKMYPIEVKVFQKLSNGEELEWDVSKERIELELDSLTDRDQPCTHIRVQLINHSDKELYCVLLYMNMLFTSNPGILPGNGVWLEPGGKVEAAGGNYIEVKHYPYVDYFKWDYFLDTLKLIISTEQFDPMMLFLPELPQPPKSTLRDIDEARSWSIPDPGNSPPPKDWSTFKVEVYTRKPQEELG